MARAVFVASLAAASCLWAGQTECPLVPIPKLYKDHGKLAELRPREAAIAVGQGATEPERYAAERLAWLINRRFKAKLPIANEGEIPGDRKQLLLLGQRTTNKLLDRLCTDHGLELSDEKPGFDGFIIEAVEDAGRQVVLVGGSNPRGVVYGAHAFFDLLRRDGSRIVFPIVSVRDWPSILWRGRPHSYLRQHLQPGVMDAYAWARLNFIDIRYAPDGGKASMGTEPGITLDTEMIKRVLSEAHRRGMFVYGTVSCSVHARDHLAVLTTFRQFIALGVDGLWLSFDDRGKGEDPSALVTKVLKLGKQHGISGPKIAITPPSGSYQRIETDFNRRIAQVPGMAEARWFFTRVPSLADARAAEAIGLKRKPSWWHNWPRTAGGFTHEGYGGRTLRADGKPSYLDLPPLSLGWHNPRYRVLRSAPACTDAVMMWGMWPEEYVCGVLGIWAWHPEEHDWDLTRRAVYAHVFGPSHAADAAAFDDKLAELKGLFNLPRGGARPGKDWPPILKEAGKKKRALDLADELGPLLARIDSGARREGAIAPARLERLFLEPMHAELEYARRAAELEDPAAVLKPLDEKLGPLLAADETTRIEEMIAQAERSAIGAAERNAAKMKDLLRVHEAVRAWRARLASIRRCVAGQSGKAKKLDAPFRHARQEEIADRLRALSVPPGGHALAQLEPRDWLNGVVRWWGPVIIGTVEHNGGALAISFGHPPRNDVLYLAQFDTQLSKPKSNGDARLFLDLFLSDPIHYNGKPSHRVARLWVNGQLVIERDLKANWRGREWATADVTKLLAQATKVKVRLRIEDRTPRTVARTIVFLGPLRLRQER